MFTKLFKKSHDPYELGGRWYRITYKITSSSSSTPTEYEFIHNDLTANGIDHTMQLGGTTGYLVIPKKAIIDGFSLDPIDPSNTQISLNAIQSGSYGYRIAIPGGSRLHKTITVYVRLSDVLSI